MYYNGWEVHPQALRIRSEGFAACGDSLEAIRNALKELLGDDSFLGNDEAGRTFREKTYRPMLASIDKSLDDCAKNMHEIKKNLHKMAGNYEKADDASTVRV